MLSTNMPAGTQGRRIQHRRQASTPAAFDAPQLRSQPASTSLRRQHRSGMSLDLRGISLGAAHAAHAAQHGHYPDYTTPGSIDTQPFPQDDTTVSITNLGQPSQHSMQVAQPHSQHQPGLPDAFLGSPVQTSFPSPRTPHRSLRAQSPPQPHQQAPHSPSKPPTEQQLRDLREHIQSVYGSCGQVFINILPTPTGTPQKPVQLASHEPLTAITQPTTHFADMTNINLEPTSSAMTFDFENPEVDLGYESSSYYTSDALSPSPVSSPTRETRNSFLEGIDEHHEMIFSQPPALLPLAQNPVPTSGLALDVDDYEQSPAFNDLDIDASLEYTGIAPEEVLRYISDQDAITGKWTCLYQDCGKVFGRRENIRSHVQTHLGDRQFKCNGCGKCFVRQHDLKRHAKIHSGNKPYKCPCGAGFARQDALTRHRQRGMCVGGFADAVRRQAKRGRPKKNRPEMEDRMDKAMRTRRALASAAPSSAGSPYSEARSPSPHDGYEASQSQPLSQLISDERSYNEPLNSSNVPFSLDTTSSPYADETQIVQSNFLTSSYANDMVSMNILQPLSENSQTPPMSPTDPPPSSSHTTEPSHIPANYANINSMKVSSPSRSSIQSSQFTTPPTSPMASKDDLNELFELMPDTSYSQFDLEMKAMGDFASLDNPPYDLLDFTV